MKKAFYATILILAAITGMQEANREGDIKHGCHAKVWGMSYRNRTR